MFFGYSLTGCGFDQPFLNCQYSKIKAMPIDLGLDRSIKDRLQRQPFLDDFAVKTLHTSNSALLGNGGILLFCEASGCQRSAAFFL